MLSHRQRSRVARSLVLTTPSRTELDRTRPDRRPTAVDVFEPRDQSITTTQAASCTAHACDGISCAVRGDRPFESMDYVDPVYQMPASNLRLAAVSVPSLRLMRLIFASERSLVMLHAVNFHSDSGLVSVTGRIRGHCGKPITSR